MENIPISWSHEGLMMHSDVAAEAPVIGLNDLERQGAVVFLSDVGELQVICA